MYVCKYTKTESVKLLFERKSLLNFNVCSGAALEGYLNVLVWLRTLNYKYDNLTTSVAAKRGHLGVLKWLVANGCPWSVTTASKAAKNGYLDILKWIKVRGIHYSAYSIIHGALLGGHLHILSWAFLENNWELKNYISFSASQNGHMHVIKWLREHNYPLDLPVIVVNMAKHGNLEWLEEVISKLEGPVSYPQLFKNIFIRAASHGHVKVMNWIAPKISKMDEWCTFTASQKAARHGHLHVLRWMREMGYQVDIKWTCAWAAYGGHIDVIDWLKEMGLSDICISFSAAIMGGQPEVIIHLKEMWPEDWAYQHLEISNLTYQGAVKIARWIRINDYKYKKPIFTDASYTVYGLTYPALMINRARVEIEKHEEHFKKKYTLYEKIENISN